MPESLFRKSSLEGLHSPEQLDQLLVVVKPKGWIAVITLFLLLVAVVIWSFAATIPVQVATRGIINTPDQFFTVKSLIEGSVVDIKVKKGDFVEVGQPLFVLSQQNDGMLQAIDSPVRGIIFLIDVDLQDFVTKGKHLVSVSEALKKGQQMQAFGYLPVHYQGEVIAGMPAEVKVQEAVFKGKVASISPYALSPSEILTGVPSTKWLEFLNPTQEPVLEVAIELDLSSPQMREKYASLKPGDLGSILITTAEEKPIKFVIP